MKLRDTDETREYIETHTIEQCKEHFGVARETLRNFSKKHGVVPKRENKRSFNIDRFREYAATHNAEELAEEFHLAKCSVYQICRNLNIKRKRKVDDVEVLRDEMMVYLRDKYTFEQIGMVFSVSRQRVHQVVERLKKAASE